MKRIGHETFVESVETYVVPDVSFYIEMSVNALERRELWLGTYRLNLDLRGGGVHRELLATVTARLAQWHINELGERTGVFVARNRYGQGFTFRLQEKHFQSTRHITRVVCVAGGIGAVIIPDKARAFMRAVLHLSEIGEPMSHDELHTLSQHQEEVDPFDDDCGF